MPPDENLPLRTPFALDDVSSFVLNGTASGVGNGGGGSGVGGVGGGGGVGGNGGFLGGGGGPTVSVSQSATLVRGGGYRHSEPVLSQDSGLGGDFSRNR